MTNHAKAAKRTYTLPLDTVERFEREVPAGHRSETINRLITYQLDEVEKQRLRTLVVEGLADMADVYEELNRDWRSVDREGWPAE